MLWGGRWEGGSCLGTHVSIKDFKIKKKKRINFKKWKKNAVCHRNIQIPCQLHCNQIFNHATLSLVIYNHCFTLMLL